MLILQKNEMAQQLADLTGTLSKFEKTIEELVQEKTGNCWSHV